MTFSWWKLFLADRLYDAHLLMGFLEQNGVPALLVEDNDVAVQEDEPLAASGIRVYVPLERREDVVRFFQHRFSTDLPGPYTGSLNVEHRRRNTVSGIVLDETGEETLVSARGPYDPLANVDPLNLEASAKPAVSGQVCAYCQAVSPKTAKFCEKCGENFPEE
jgi:ribosomal protein L40E